MSDDAFASRPQPRRGVTWRGVLLGLLGVIIICGLTPYNDYALNNVPLVGNNLPLGVVFALFLFIFLVNAPLHRFAPRYAFGPGEITVALAMMLVSCALPSSGLMRYFLPSLISPFWHAQNNHDYLNLLERLEMPRWLFPDFQGDSPREWMRDPAVDAFFSRWDGEGPPPYRIWITPLLAWGIFFIGLFGAFICMVSLVRHQWHENERLAFPLAQIQLALIEPPAPGRMLNQLFRQRSFWIALGGIVFLHAWNGSEMYFPQYFPGIPIRFNFHSLMSEPPLVYTHGTFKQSTIYFIILGVTYFLSTPVAFSLWFFFVAQQVHRMIRGAATGDPAPPGEWDQHFGAVLAFALMVLWIGRHHWALILRQALRGERAGEPRGRYLSHVTGFWGLCACVALMIGWLVAAGSDLPGALVTIALLMTLFLVVTRVIAETGLVYSGLSVPFSKPFQLAVLAGWSKPVSLESVHLNSMLHLHHYDFREPLPVYASHALKIADQAIFARRTGEEPLGNERRIGRRIIAAMVLALVVGYFLSAGSSLWTYYTYAYSMDSAATAPINRWGAEQAPVWMMMEQTMQYQREAYQTPHSRWHHVTYGFLFTGLLGYLRLTLTWWPFHPIGYLLVATTPGQRIWFSVMLGWLAKVLIVKYGGARLYTGAKPFFLGLIVGEAAAAAVWMVMGILLSSLGVAYHPVQILPR